LRPSTVVSWPEGRGRGRGREDDFLLEGQLGEQLVEGAQRVDPAVVDDADARAEAGGLLHVVRRVNDRESLAVALFEVVEDRVARLGIDADGGFVAEEEFRPVQQRGDEIEPPLHAARIIFHGIMAAVREADGSEGLVNPFAQHGAAEAVEPAKRVEVLLGAELLEQRDGLRHEAHGGARGGIGGHDHDAVEGEGAGIGGAQAGGERHERGLAGAVGPEQAEEFAAGDVEGHAIKRGERAVALGDGPEGKHGSRERLDDWEPDGKGKVTGNLGIPDGGGRKADCGYRIPEAGGRRQDTGLRIADTRGRIPEAGYLIDGSWTVGGRDPAEIRYPLSAIRYS
jgi:hypothetical protein